MGYPACLPAGWLTTGLTLLIGSALAVFFWPTMIADRVREGKTLSVLTEVVFLVALLLLALATWHAGLSNHQKIVCLRPLWVLLMGSALVISQVIFLRFGPTMTDGHELTEIREIAISLAIVAYSVILLQRFCRQYGHSADLVHQN